jgi:hypothetical protein
MKTTLRRILKYTPAVVLGLLVVAWVVSWFGELQHRTCWGYADVWFVAGRGSYSFWGAEAGTIAGFTNYSSIRGGPPKHPRDVMGRWRCDMSQWKDGRQIILGIPLLSLITGILPLAVGCTTGFRFSLWHYLAYTALVAVELSYYLR